MMSWGFPRSVVSALVAEGVVALVKVSINTGVPAGIMLFNRRLQTLSIQALYLYSKDNSKTQDSSVIDIRIFIHLIVEVIFYCRYKNLCVKILHIDQSLLESRLRKPSSKRSLLE